MRGAGYITQVQRIRGELLRKIVRLIEIIGRLIFASRGDVWKRVLQTLLVYGAYQKFKTSPAMFRAAVGFAGGLYTGLFAAQNYNVPKVASPAEAWHSVSSFVEDKTKAPPATSS
ncbi:hypothetical protein BV898_03892 [Hypsibius exemplaris]|uniref:Uncharacterized protein n=1 Tax=Hypsibius exemplaris TaxID=2072580 RepID=A0A1W0X3F5_HYPEX|nr:hypothetical protein BV898_03892 [Hypsibius exemplaris]